MTYAPSAPILVGLTGSIASGKTATAQALSPAARVLSSDFDDDGYLSIHWQHVPFALPLHQMATVRQTTTGDGAFDRMCYQIHAILLDVFGASPLYGAPPYNDLVKMVQQIVSFPVVSEGKPRKFLQHVGTEVVRAYNPDAWVTWMDRKVRGMFMQHCATRGEESERPFGVVIDDVRMLNEAEYIRSAPNGLLIKLWARPDIIAERLYDRDSTFLTEDVLNHESERQAASIPDDWCTAIIDTSDMSIEIQVAAIRELVASRLGGGISAHA